MSETDDIDRQLSLLEAEIKKLEAEYNMYFAGRLQRPPWEMRKRVEWLVKQLDRAHIPNYGQRFRFNTLQITVCKIDRPVGSRPPRARRGTRPVRSRSHGPSRGETQGRRNQRTASCTSPPSKIR